MRFARHGVAALAADSTSVDVRARRWSRLLPLMVCGAVVLVLGSVMISNVFPVSPIALFRFLSAQHDIGPLDHYNIETRLPRGLLALLVGAAPACSGALLQALTRNPLASPDILGVSQGAVAAVLLTRLLFPVLPFALVNWVPPVAGLVGGVGAALVLYLVTRGFGAVGSTQFILISVLMARVLSSVSTMALIFLGSGANDALDFLTGSLNLKTWGDVGLATCYLIPGVILLTIAIPRANLMQLGDDVAGGLGQHEWRDRLMGPHMARRVVGSDIRRLIPAAGLTGGILVGVSDLLAQNVLPHQLLGSLGRGLGLTYLPVGVYLALFGVPFMISLVRRQR